MLEDIKSFTSIPNPLALAGLIVGGLIMIFLALLKLDLFPRFNRTDAGKFLNRIAILIFVLALVGMILGFIGYILPMLINGDNKNGNVTPTPINTPTPTPEPTPSITIPKKGNYTLGTAIETLSKDDGHGMPHFKNNCSNSIKNAVLKPGTIGAPDITSLINKLQYNLKESISNQIYEAKLTEVGYEIDCK